MNVREQSAIYWQTLTTRKRNPIKGATRSAYKSYLDRWILPEIGELEISAVENGVMKRLVAKLAEEQLSASTIAGITNCLKGIVGSAIDDNGNELHPRKWNTDFIDAPILDPKLQKAPIISGLEVTAAIGRVSSQFGMLFALLAGSGMRISEALALRTIPDSESSYWDANRSILVIKKALWHGQEQTTKTPAGVREIDLAPELNDYLKPLQDRKGFLFGGETPIRVRTAYDVLEKAQVPGYHSFRRFRCTHLENFGVPRGLVMFWTGHAGKDVHDRYVKLDKDKEARRDWAVKAGLGFELPKEKS